MVKPVMALTEPVSWMGVSDLSSDEFDMCSCNFTTVRLSVLFSSRCHQSSAVATNPQSSSTRLRTGALLRM